MALYRLMDGQSGRPGVGSSGTQPPASVTSYAGDYITGLAFEVTEGGHYFQGYWWWVPSGGDTNAPNCALWQVTGTGTAKVIEQSIIQWGNLTAGQWNFIPCVPIPLTPNIPYLAAIGYTATNGYPQTQNQFGSGDPYADGITNGPLTAYSSITGSNPAPGGFPQSPFDMSSFDPSYFVPATNDADDLLWLDVQITDQVPPLSPERAWANMPVPYPAATAASTQRTLGMEFTLSQESKLDRIWHYAPEVTSTQSFSLWQQTTDTNMGLPKAPGGGGAYTIGNEFEVSQDCKVEAIWFWSVPGSVVLPSSCAVYMYGNNTALEAVSSPTWLKPDGSNASAGDGWVKCVLSGSTIATSGNAYYTTVFSASGSNWWSYSGSYWYNGTGSSGSGGGGMRNGPLSAPGHSSTPAPQNGQGVIHVGGASITYPESSWADNNVFVDVQVSANAPASLPSRCAIWDTSTSSIVAGTDKTSPTWLNSDGTPATGLGWVYCDYRSSNLTLPAGTYKVSTYSSGGTNWYAETASVFGGTIIGQVGVDGQNNGSPYTLSYTSKPGSTLVIAGYLYHPSLDCLPTSITDSAGNTWKLSTSNAADPPTQEVKIGGAYRTTFIAWCDDASPVTSVSIAREDNDASNSWWRFSFLEITGIAGLDDSNAGSDTSGSNSTFNLPAITLNHEEDLVIGVAANSSDSAETTPAGWTVLSGGFGNWSAGGYDTPGTTGSYSPQWSASLAGEWVSVVAAFRPGFTQDILQVGVQSYNAGGWGYPAISTGGAADWIDVEVTPVLKATYSLFNQPSAPASLTIDTSSYTLGMEFKLSQDATFTGIWFYSASGAGQLPTHTAIFDVVSTAIVPGTEVDTASWSGALGSGWVKQAYDGSVTLKAGIKYKVAVYAPAGSSWYAATSHYWDTGVGANGMTAGIISAPGSAGADSGQDSFNSGGVALVYPGGAFNASNYWIDVEVQSPHFRLMDGVDGRPGSGPSNAVSWGGNFLAGTEFAVLASDCWFEGYWWWVCPGSGGSPIQGETAPQKFCIWNVTNGGVGTVLPDSIITSGTLSLGWNYIPLPTPIPLSVSTPYLVATGFTGNFPDSDTAGSGTGAVDSFGTGGHTNGIFNGPLMAYSNSYTNDNNCTNQVPGIGGTQGGFSTGGSDPTTVFPGGSSNSMNTWIDAQISYGAPSSYSGTYRMFPNHYGYPMFAGGDAAVDYVLGTEMRLSEECALNKIWYYSPNGTSQMATECAVWNMETQQKVAEDSSPTWYKPDGSAGAPGATWLYCDFSNVTLPAGRYRVSIYNDAVSPDSWSAKNLYFYNAGAGNFFAGVTPPSQPVYTIGPTFQGIRNGPVFVPSFPDSASDIFYSGGNALNLGYAGAAGSGNFAVGPPNAYPDLYVKGLGQNYWVDMEVTPSSGNPNLLLALFP
jgi:hypothetical protein